MVQSFVSTPAPEESQIVLVMKEWFSLGSLKNFFLQRKVIALIAAILIFCIGLLSTNTQQPAQQTISPELARIQQIEQLNYQVAELTRQTAVNNFTFNTAGITPNSGVPERVSDLQAAINNAVLDYRQRIQKQTISPDSPYYQKHESLAYQGADVNTAKLSLAAAEGTPIVIKFRDPETGKNVEMEFSEDEAMALAILRNQVAKMAQSKAVVKETNRMDLAKGLWGNISAAQATVKQLVELQGYQDVADQLGNSDLFGRPLVAPQIVPEGVPQYEQPSVAPQVQQQSFAPKQEHRPIGNQTVSYVLQAHPGY